MLIAGRDPCLLDSYCAGLIGYNARDIKHLLIASEIGVGKVLTDDTKVLELNAESKTLHSGYGDWAADGKFAPYINEDMACSPCHTALVMALMHTSTPRNTIDVGQGFRKKHGQLGCGNCTSNHDSFVPGCPPKVTDIIDFLISRGEVVKKGTMWKSVSNDNIKGLKIIVFGAGSTGLKYAEDPEIRDNILFYIDNDTAKQEAGIKVNDISFDVYPLGKAIPLLPDDAVILIASLSNRQEIHELLLTCGVRNAILFD
jgi:hypothetical protein